LQADNESGSRGDAAPAVEFPTGTEEFDFGAERNVENHFGGAAIELLRDFEQGALAEVLAVGGAPDGDVEGFLFDLIGDGEDAEKGAGGGFGDFDGRAVGVGFEGRVGRDEREFEGHEIPFLNQGEFSTDGSRGSEGWETDTDW
jgi:hypothetical protein